MPSIAGVKSRVRRVGAVATWAARGARTELIRPPADAPNDITTVLYLHHSTGERIWRGGIPKLLAQEDRNRSSHCRIVEHAYPHGPYPWRNDPYDYWNLWVRHRGGKGHLGQATLDHLAGHWDVIVVKNCFTTSMMTTEGTSPKSKTLTNYRRHMSDLKALMHEFSDTTFLVWTPPPLVEAVTTPQAAGLTEDYTRWLRQEWDEPGDNIHLWDFRAIAATDGYLRPEYAASPRDSHPNAALAAHAAPLFVRRLTDVIEGRGDQRPATGETSIS